VYALSFSSVELVAGIASLAALMRGDSMVRESPVSGAESFSASSLNSAARVGRLDSDRQAARSKLGRRIRRRRSQWTVRRDDCAPARRRRIAIPASRPASSGVSLVRVEVRVELNFAWLLESVLARAGSGRTA
jgi:hypothetical protein